MVVKRQGNRSGNYIPFLEGNFAAQHIFQAYSFPTSNGTLGNWQHRGNRTSCEVGSPRPGVKVQLPRSGQGPPKESQSLPLCLFFWAHISGPVLLCTCYPITPLSHPQGSGLLEFSLQSCHHPPQTSGICFSENRTDWLWGRTKASQLSTPLL